MMGGSHVLFGAASWLVVASQAGLPVSHVAAGLPAAMAFSTLPDVDNRPIWRKLDKWLPDEAFGAGGPLQHRGVAHWLGWPAAGAAALYVLTGAMRGADPQTVFVWAALVGWASHLVGDFVWGQAGFGTGRGVPLMPWWAHVGLGLKCGGVTERLALPVVAAVMLWWAVDMPGLGYVGLA